MYSEKTISRISRSHRFPQIQGPVAALNIFSRPQILSSCFRCQNVQNINKEQNFVISGAFWPSLIIGHILPQVS